MLNMGSLKDGSWGPFLFHAYINDLSLKISAFADVIIFADDTSILTSDKNYDDFKESFNPALMYLSKWLQAYQLVLNVGRTNITKFAPSKSS